MPRSTPPTAALPSEIRIVTDCGGTIIGACPEAPRGLRISSRSLLGRELALFFGADRPELLNRLAAAAALGEPASFAAILRPRECRPFAVQVTVNPVDGPERDVEWIIKFEGLTTPGPAFSADHRDPRTSERERGSHEGARRSTPASNISGSQ